MYVCGVFNTLNDWKNDERKVQLTRVLIAFLALVLVCVAYPMKKTQNTKEAISEHVEDVVEKTEAPVPTIEVIAHDENQSETDVVEAINNNRETVKVKGIYVSGPMAGTKKQMADLISLVNRTELNAMVIDIKNDSGEITYKMDYPYAEKIGATKNYISDMKALVSRLKENNIYLIARIVTFKDPILANARNDLSVLNNDGSVFHDKKGLAWVNPFKKKVWNYNLEIALRAAEMGFDEIQFDYIRFSTDAGMKNVTFGRKAVTKSKQETISEFTEYAHRVLGQKGVKVSADVYGTIINSEGDSEIVGQNYKEMANHLDYICPMIYPSQYAPGAYGIKSPDAAPYEIVYNALKDSMSVLNESKEKHAIVRPWIQDFTATWIDGHIKYSKKQVEQQIKAVYEAGYEEWILWNARNSYSLA